MPMAARLDDKISHTLAAGFGTPVGLACMGLSIMLCPAAAIVYGITIMIAEEVAIDQGEITSGSGNVIIGGSPAARAGQDKAKCKMHGVLLIAQGSSTVFTNKKMAARKKDLLPCSGKISSGCFDVIIGGATGTAVSVSPEIPTWAMTAITAIGLVTGVALGIASGGVVVGGLAVLGCLAGGALGEEGGKWLGGQVADHYGMEGEDREDLERRFGKIGGVLGGVAGGAAAGAVGAKAVGASSALGKINNLGRGPGPLSPGAPKSAEPEMPGGKVAEPEVPGGKAAEPEVPGGKAAEPEAPGGKAAEPEVPGGKAAEPEAPGGKAAEPEPARGKASEPEKAPAKGEPEKVTPTEETPGKASKPEKVDCTTEPVVYSTGVVIDEQVEFALPGAIPIECKRFYSSDRAHEVGPFGKGGWTHTFEQWIEEKDAVLSLHAEGGRSIYFEKVGPGESTFHRRERLTLTRSSDGGFRVESAKTGLIHVFTSIGSGRAALSAIRDGYGNQVTLSYEGLRLSRIVDTAGRLIRFLYTPENRIGRIEVWSADPVPERWQWVQYSYSSGGTLASAVDALNATRMYEYDALQRLTRYTRPSGVSFYYTYDPETGRCVRTVGDGGLFRTDLHYDVAARTTQAVGNGEPRIFVSNDQGMTIRESTLSGNWVRERVYDDDQYLLSEANAAGDTTRFVHDERGNLTKHIDPAGNVTTWEIEHDKPIVRRTPDGLATRYAYDALGKLAAVSTPLGLTYQLAYDARGDLASVHGPDGLVAGFSYDDQHNLVQEVDARGAVTQYAYDALGRPVAVRDALGRETCVVYDALGRPTQIRFPDGTAKQMARDYEGRVIREVDALGNVTSFEYSGLGALSKIVEPTGQQWSLVYDELERVRKIINPRSETYEYDYDDVGRIVKEKSFHGRTLRYSYSTSENLARVEYPNETSRSFGYDRLGNLLADDALEGSIAFARDQLGRLKSARVVESSGKVITTFERDAYGRVIAEAQGDLMLRYAYDARGRRSERAMPNGATTRYRYDAGGLLGGLDHDGHQVSFHRDVLGREVRRHVNGSGLDIRSAYDASDRLCNQEVSAPRPGGYQAAEMLSHRRWKYDENGRVAAIADSRWGATHYSYDRLGRLVSATRGTHQEVFGYDTTGSLTGILTELAQADRAAPWTTRDGNVLVESNEATYENDSQGRRTKRVDKTTGESAEYSWDCRDQLREVLHADGRRSRYTYDAFGRRVRKEIVAPNGNTGTAPVPTKSVVAFLWDGDVLAAELGRTEGDRIFVHDPGTFTPVLQQEQGAVFTYVNDHHGMPKELIDDGGRVAWAAAHSAWGAVAETWRDPEAKRAVESPFRMLGQYLDDETGLCYTRFRYFDAEVGRWISPDPIGVAGGANLLAWDGAPTTTVDPLGLIGSAQGLRGAEFENWLQEKLGASGNFKSGGREFDGAVGNRWLEAKSGKYWESQTKPGSAGYSKFQSDIASHQSIAARNGASLEVHSNTPIPEHVKSWLDKRGIEHHEHC